MFNSYKSKRDIRRLLHILLACAFIFLSRGALAMKCIDADTGSEDAMDTILNAAVPSTEPDGSMVWRSKTAHLKLQCWADTGKTTENIYLYTNPNKAPVAEGIQLGVVLNGQVFDDVSQGTKWQIPGWHVDCKGGGTSDTCKKKSSYYDLEYYITVKKKGNLNGKYSGNDEFDVFQLDGSGGLNINGNYRYKIAGLTNIRFIGCSANVNVEPTVIDFGTFIIPTTVTPDTLAGKKNFSIDVSRTCTDPFSLTAIYTTTADVDGDKAKFNGMYLKLFDQTHNTYINFSDLTHLMDFADLTDLLSVKLAYTAELYWDGSALTAGEYSPTVTVAIFYN